jgi:hypothetical protein
MKPLIDCFWNDSLTTFLGSRVNLQSVVGIAIPLAILVRALMLREWRRYSLTVWLAVAYVGDLALGVVISPNRGSAVGDFLRVALPLAFLSAGFQAGTNPKRIRLAAGALALYALVPVLLALLELGGVIAPKEGGVVSEDQLVRVRGLYQHPLDIAMRCSMAFPFALVVWRTSAEGVRKTAAAFWAAVCAVTATATLVRSAMAVTVAEVFSWLWLTGHRKSALLATGTAVALALSIGPAREVIRQSARPLKTGEIHSFGSGRLLLFVSQLAGFSDGSLVQKSLGRGLHTTAAVTLEYSPLRVFNPIAADYEEGKITAHNQLIRILTESGIVGVFLFCGLVAAAFRGSLLAAGSRDPVARSFALATTCALVAACVYSISATPFDGPAFSWPLWFSVGVVERIGRSTTKERLYQKPADQSP